MVLTRWWLQVVGLVLYSVAFYLCLQRYRVPRPRWYLGPVLAWLGTQVLFYVFLVCRVIVYLGEPPVSLTLVWLANLLWLQGAVSLSMTFYLSERGPRA